MINKFTKNTQKGFTLIEVIVSIAVILILACGVHSMYVNMIKSTKTSEEKQNVALNGKRILENIKNVPSDNITLSGGKISVKGLNFIDEDSITMNGSKESFSRTFYLDKFYKYCNQSAGKYEASLSVSKMKTGDNNDIDIDMSVDNLNEDEDEINRNVNTIDEVFSITKTIEENTPKIEDRSIKKEDGKYVLNIYIEKNSNEEAAVIIKDADKNEIAKKYINLESSGVNHLNIHFNYKDYYINEHNTGEIKDMIFNVYNSVNDESILVSNVYIETSVNINVDVEAKKGDIFIYRSDADRNIESIGPLYYIDLEIKDIDDDKVVFSERAARNIEIKGD